jgi:hypothetical protein
MIPATATLSLLSLKADGAGSRAELSALCISPPDYGLGLLCIEMSGRCHNVNFF